MLFSGSDGTLISTAPAPQLPCPARIEQTGPACLPAPVASGRTHGASSPLSDLFRRTTYAVARTKEDREFVCAVRHKAYIANGLFAPARPRCELDALDLAENCVLVIAGVGGQPCASFRMHLARGEAYHTPSVASRPDQLMPIVRMGRSIVDLSCICVDPARSEIENGLVCAAIRLALIVAVDRGAVLALRTRLENESFFKCMLGCRRVGAPQLEPGGQIPLLIMTCDVVRSYCAIVEMHPEFAADPDEVDSILAETGICRRARRVFA